MATTSISSIPTPKAATDLIAPNIIVKESPETMKVDPEVEKKVLMVLCDINLDIPCNAAVIADHTTKALGRGITLSSIEVLLQKFASQQLIRFDLEKIEKSFVLNCSIHFHLSKCMCG